MYCSLCSFMLKNICIDTASDLLRAFFRDHKISLIFMDEEKKMGVGYPFSCSVSIEKVACFIS